MSDGSEQLVERMTALVALEVTCLYRKSQVVSKDVLHMMRSFLFKKGHSVLKRNFLMRNYENA